MTRYSQNQLESPRDPIGIASKSKELLSEIQNGGIRHNTKKYEIYGGGLLKHPMDTTDLKFD